MATKSVSGLFTSKLVFWIFDIDDYEYSHIQCGGNNMADKNGLGS